jgi:hypothetical protein
MNTIVKAFAGLGLGATAVMVVFYETFNIVAFLMFFACFLPVVLVVMWDEMITPGSWPVKTLLFKVREGKPSLTITRARREKDKFGRYSYKIRSEGGKMKALDYKYMETYRTSGFRSEDLIMLFSPAPGQYHPMTMEKLDELVKIKVIPQELLNFSLETHRDQYGAHPDKKKFLQMLMENPTLMFCIGLGILFICLGIFLNQMFPVMDAMKSFSATFLRQGEVANELLMRWENISAKLEATSHLNETLLPKPGS